MHYRQAEADLSYLKRTTVFVVMSVFYSAIGIPETVISFIVWTFAIDGRKGIKLRMAARLYGTRPV